MEIERLTKIKGCRQDGAIFGGYLFSFNADGKCSVYETKNLGVLTEGEAEVYTEFRLDPNVTLVPHCNAVMFGNEYYDKEDEFPLLYANVYNNYANAEDKLEGVCLVYRLQRQGTAFTTTLVQMIEIGFTNDEMLWKSCGEKADARPYGNFTIDTEKGIYYAFTMRDNADATRYFSFDLPKVTDGEFCEKYKIKRVVLNASDIKTQFDCPYHRFIQGACCHKGKIYSLEGFSNSAENPPAIRVIDPELKAQIAMRKFGEFGIHVEAELIDFENDTCYYADHHGNLYKILLP